jgi:hypothetical protein
MSHDDAPSDDAPAAGKDVVERLKQENARLRDFAGFIFVSAIHGTAALQRDIEWLRKKNKRLKRRRR